MCNGFSWLMSEGSGKNKQIHEVGFRLASIPKIIFFQQEIQPSLWPLVNRDVVGFHR